MPTAIANLEAICNRGVGAGFFRKDIAPIDLHWHISALCFFNISNQATFAQIFKVDLVSQAAQAARRQQVVEMILRYVAPLSRPPVSPIPKA